jgi:hypothetical protein
MFGLFRKRLKGNADGNAKLAAALDASHNLLMTQFDLGGAFDVGEAQKRMVEHYPFGYVFGFTDAMIQSTGVTNDVQVMAHLTLAFTRLFGDDKGARIIANCFDSRGVPEFAAGRGLGAREAMSWVGGRGGFTPSGLVDYLQTGQVPQA